VVYVEIKIQLELGFFARTLWARHLDFSSFDGIGWIVISPEGDISANI
jgi:hypothetical protein